jgi:CheY-specific phosphatase CheX
MDFLGIDEIRAKKIVNSTNAGFMMASVTPSPVGASQLTPASHDIAVVIGMVGKRNGTVTLNISNKAACHVAAAFLGSEFSEVSPEVLDAVGELTNIIAGRMKAEFSEEYGISHISCPSIIIGGDYRMYHFQGFKTVSVEFVLDDVKTMVFQEKLFSLTLSISNG